MELLSFGVYTFDQVSLDIGVDGFFRASLACILGHSTPRSARLLPGNVSQSNNFTAQEIPLGRVPYVILICSTVPDSSKNE